QVRVIRDLEARIAQNRKRLAEIDEQLAALAAPHMSAVPGSHYTPYETATRLIENRARHSWFTDRPTQSLSDAGVNKAEMEALFAARRTIKKSLKYLGERLPSPANLPDPETVRGWHQDLLAAQDLVAQSEALEILTRRTIAKLGLEGAERLAASLKDFASRMD